LGKRRMTHLSEAIPTSAPNPVHIWGLFGNAGRTQWRWEAPTPRLSKNDDTAALPAWLSEWDTTFQEDPNEILRADSTEERTLVEGIPTMEEDVRRFRETLRSKSDLDSHIADFNQSLKQSLTLGLASSELVEHIIRQVTEDLQEVSKNHEVARARYLAFYNAIWDGITASRVLRPIDFDGKVINEFLSLLSRLPSTREVQTLAHRILCSMSVVQLRCLEQGIISLVKSWLHSWLEVSRIGDSQPEIRAAEEYVAETGSKLVNVQRLVMALEEGSNAMTDISLVREAVSDIHMSISRALGAIAKADQSISPFKASAKLLADALQKLPYDLLLSIVPSCSEHIMMVCKGRRKSFQTVRYHWLSTIAQLSNIDTELFLQNWRKLESQDTILENDASDLILSLWMSQGYVKNIDGVRNSFEASAPRPEKKDFASLLFALDKHRENSLTRTRDLFLLLEGLGRYKMVYKILSRMNNLSLKVPATCLARSIDTMSSHDVHLALKIFSLRKVMLLGDRRFRLDWIPDFIIALINDRSVEPKRIWEILGIPIYEYRPRFQRHFQPRALPQTMIDLLHRMALAFAQSPARPTRVAVRNVLQCLYHLRLHRAPISPELARAMSSAGITREIIAGQWIREDRLHYTLVLIDELEGKEVADKVDATVLNWRQHLSEKQARRAREGNVLRVGPID
jgi:hypothetical protein